jgi:hypothetical protein
VTICPILFRKLWTRRPIVLEEWKSLIYLTHLVPEVSALLYYWGICEEGNIFRRAESPVQIFFISEELLETTTFFITIFGKWEQINPGDSYSSGNDFKVDLIDPVSLKPIMNILVIKAYESKARPLLLEFTFRDGEKSSVILKKGDDIRNDWYVQTMFEIFNHLWRNSYLSSNPPVIYTYKCIPIYPMFGCIECVTNVKSVQDFDYEKISQLEQDQKNILLSSLAGSCLASYVLGIRDRHQDNMLIKDDHIFFHIDFGHLWNRGPIIDAPRISIPMRFKAKLAAEWPRLEQLCLEGFKVLFQHGDLIKTLCATLFKSTTENSMIIEQFVRGRNSLMLDMSELEANGRFEKILTKSLENHHVRRKIKNWAHELSRSNTDSRRRTSPTGADSSSKPNEVKK